MKQTTVWLNTHFNCIQPIRDADSAGQFRIVTSYHSRKYADVILADHFELEPKLADDQYVDYALDFVRRHGVDIILPGRKMELIAGRIDEFHALGVKVILAGDAETLAVLDNKGRFYDALGSDLLPVPSYKVASDALSFSTAVALLQEQNPVVCFKPTVGIFGYGFKIITTEENLPALEDVDRLLLTDKPAALKLLSEKRPFKEQLVMEYLPGEERSVDCLAHQGKLVRCVVRSKLADGSRILEHNPLMEEYTRRLIEKLNLNGIFNVQFKDKDGVPFILEINARMSGGIAMSCLSGVCLPYWALRLAMGTATEADIPHGKTGLRVMELTHAVILP